MGWEVKTNIRGQCNTQMPMRVQKMAKNGATIANVSQGI